MMPSSARSYLSLWPEKVTPYYRGLATDAPDDPIALQFKYSEAEDVEDGTSCADPFDECCGAALMPGVKQRFADRVLIMVSHACAVRCRHCTRKNLLDAEANPICSDVEGALERIRRDKRVREILISGGDPLVLPPSRLLAIVEACCRLEQIDAVRIGTRVPVTDPERVTEALARGLGCYKKVWVNTQFNHPREVTPESTRACELLVEAGIPVSNQSVLLRGVNDSAEVMIALCAKLQRIRVRPYYVFQCDPVRGTSHFRVPTERAQEIARRVTESLGGLAVPRFVIDRPGRPAKTPLKIGIEGV